MSAALLKHAKPLDTLSRGADEQGASTFAVLALGVSNILFLLSYGRDFMQAQVKYKSEVKTAVLGDRTITVKNLTPVFSPQEQDKQSREVERRLFDVFRKYAGQRG
ncbi:MAG: hypothetical protein ACLTS1_15205 [Coprococcus sp.]